MFKITSPVRTKKKHQENSVYEQQTANMVTTLPPPLFHPNRQSSEPRPPAPQCIHSSLCTSRPLSFGSLLLLLWLLLGGDATTSSSSSPPSGPLSSDCFSLGVRVSRSVRRAFVFLSADQAYETATESREGKDTCK